MMNWLKRSNLASYKTPILLGFMALNFLLTGVDVLIAHSENNFFRWELIPLIFSPLAVLVVLAQMVFQHNTVVKRTFQTIMGVGVAVGVVGTLLHLAGNSTSSQQSINSLLVTGSPVGAPIAFAGIACYTLVSAHYSGTTRRSKLLVLVGLGFLGAVIAVFLDHARLGFVSGYTMIPLVSGTLATFACFYRAYGQASRHETYIFFSILALNLLVGLVGFGFHLAGNLAGAQSIVWARMMYRNPLMGPLLFCNLAVLGGLCLLPEPDIRLGE